ncbi:hypothetical protein QEH52_14145 [Coraliomargarita sp. SDUM461003]|uniref:Uncharacterized protein n=1 Tax=Thalassobacterium maritimum TaxID=3041265 RepID=A0ABU1AWX8_9BACT|nr:hypothetical protein [Coraliomargarita sp. SDUM461003]MDQ8208663.1 hypothetical protein [Coraliomargarita sp. SDUM461003]
MPVVKAQSSVGASLSRRILSPLLRISLLVGVCVHLAGFLLFHVISNPLPKREASPPFVQYVSQDRLLSGAALEEQAALFDSAPLFVPGQWNAAHNLNPPSLERGQLRFPAYEPKIDFSTALVPPDLMDGLDASVSEPIDLLDLRYWDLFRYFGQGALTPKPFQALERVAEVRSLDGHVLRVLPTAVDLLSMQAVQPATYYLRVEAGGRIVGRPTLSASSGDTSFDAVAYTWLLEAGFPADLQAGFFEVRIYP